MNDEHYNQARQQAKKHKWHALDDASHKQIATALEINFVAGYRFCYAKLIEERNDHTLKMQIKKYLKWRFK